jgi:hypothetical protein
MGSVGIGLHRDEASMTEVGFPLSMSGGKTSKTSLLGSDVSKSEEIAKYGFRE